MYMYMKKNIGITVDVETVVFHRKANNNISSICNKALIAAMGKPDEVVQKKEAEIQEFKKASQTIIVEGQKKQVLGEEVQKLVKLRDKAQTNPHFNFGIHVKAAADKFNLTVAEIVKLMDKRA